MASRIKDYKQELNDQLVKDIMAIRIPHTKAATETAMMIADRVPGKINKYDLVAACMYHDIAKELEYEKMVKIIINAMESPFLMDVIGSIDMAEYESPKWLHGIVGAIVAHELYGIKSRDVLQAIRYHKVGTRDESEFTKILITADIANSLRQARHMVTAYTTLKLRKFDMEPVYQNIVKYDTHVAVVQEDVVIPRMLQGAQFYVSKLDKCKMLDILGDYYDEEGEFIWVPYHDGDKWTRATADGVYITPGGFDNAKLVMDNIDHEKEKQVIVTLSDRDWNSYMVSFIDSRNGNNHMVIQMADALASKVRIPRGYYSKVPTRYYQIDSGDFQ